jgi:4-oxalocrotonate tautomerase
LSPTETNNSAVIDRRYMEKKMPLVSIEVIENVFTPAQKKEIIGKITDVMIAIEGEALRPYTHVKIEEIKEGDWSIGGQTLTAADVHRLQRAKAA